MKTNSNLSTFITVALIASTSLLFSSCKTADPSLPSLDSTGEASIHEVNNRQLRAVMADMKTLVFEELYSALEEEKQYRIYSREIASIVDAMAREVEQIKSIGKSLKLNEEERGEFLAYASELRYESSLLKDLARRGDTKKLRKQIVHTVNTCNSCHDRFRIMPAGTEGMLNLPARVLRRAS